MTMQNPCIEPAECMAAEFYQPAAQDICLYFVSPILQIFAKWDDLCQ